VRADPHFFIKKSFVSVRFFFGHGFCVFMFFEGFFGAGASGDCAIGPCGRGPTSSLIFNIAPPVLPESDHFEMNFWT
jgi:hypothetical protein